MKEGATFGIMDGVITILGIMWGLSITQSKLVLVVGILTAGLADSFANAAGMHVSRESKKHNHKDVWENTLSSFLSTFLVAVVLVLPLFFFTLKTALIISGIIAIIILICLGNYVAKETKKKPLSLIIEYTLMGIVISVVCLGLGKVINWFL